ncbi:histamine H2 receptor-like [Oculina patagonica]
MFSLPWCITWLVLLLTLSVAIVTLNIVTIIAFIKNRDLRKRSTYLLINLAVADMLVGGFTALDHFIVLGVKCNLWKDIVPANWIIYLIMNALGILFPICSLLNITVISAERVHATFWPFRHRIAKTWVYGLLIVGIWVTSMLLSAGLAVIAHFEQNKQNYFYLWCSFNSTCLLVICVSYAFIVINVRCGAQPQHHGAASRERKLTVTLLIVTIVSLLLWLPFVLTNFLYHTTDIISSLTEKVFLHFFQAMCVLYYGNSLVNTILYTIRMPEFRRVLVAIFKRPRQQRRVDVLPLQAI